MIRLNSISTKWAMAIATVNMISVSLDVTSSTGSHSMIGQLVGDVQWLKLTFKRTALKAASAETHAAEQAADEAKRIEWWGRRAIL
jgi:hypothetical protein